MVRIRRVLSIAVCAFCTGSALHAATISGTVKGPEGAPFRGAFVAAQNRKANVTVTVLSDRSGHYLIPNLAAGEYQVQARATGFKSEPKRGLNLTADQNQSLDFSLEKGMVRWQDLSYYQGRELLPDGKGKSVLTGTCFGCHGFESRMAAAHRTEEGWRDRVNYMRDITHFATWRMTDEQTEDVTQYINSLFGESSILPKSPADLPNYQKTVISFPEEESMKIVFVEYDLPGPSRMPFDANPAKDGSVWIPYYAPYNGVGRLDPKSGEVQEYRAPNSFPAFIHSAQMAPDGSVYFTEQASNKIGRWDPKTHEVTEFQDRIVPGKERMREGGSKHTVRVDSKGMVWASGTPFSSFDPKTGKFTDYPVVPNTYGIDIDKDDNVWFDGFTLDGKIFRVDAKTHKITGYQPPTAGLPRRIQAAPDGTIWFAEFRAGKIAHFDPKTEKFTEWQVPGPEPTPYGIGIDKKGYVWYSSEAMDVLGRLDPKTGKFIEFPFDHPENAIRELLPDSQGRLWYATGPNNKVGYFYLAE